MSIQRIGCGPRMSNAVVHGNTVYLAGRVATSAKGSSVTEQTKDILAQIDETLAEAGTDKTKILSTTIYLSDIKTFAEMNAVWDGWVAKGNTPARATVEAKLAHPDFTVEIVVVAAR
ncbi:MAG: RidA family protein [Burkholderiales bacterium]|jgi:enamine deaminase RidA (YjgF/YER057c/UK114 family)|nr:RidA family protein [Burkholderiales bacterium]